MNIQRPTKILLVGLILACAESCGFSQGTFQNLNFESANIPPGTPKGSLVPAIQAFPGWILYVDTNQQAQALYNSLFIGTATVAILGPGSTFPPIIQGNYMGVLQAGQGGSAAISQTGVIPAIAKTLLFTASPPGPNGWVASVGGQNVSVVPISPVGTLYELYGADISSLAGQTEELRFTAMVGPGPTENMALDNIMFSTTSIPEPGSWALILCGAAAWFGASRWRRKR